MDSSNMDSSNSKDETASKQIFCPEIFFWVVFNWPESELAAFEEYISKDVLAAVLDVFKQLFGMWFLKELTDSFENNNNFVISEKK